MLGLRFKGECHETIRSGRILFLDSGVVLSHLYTSIHLSEDTQSIPGLPTYHQSAMSKYGTKLDDRTQRLNHTHAEL